MQGDKPFPRWAKSTFDTIEGAEATLDEFFENDCPKDLMGTQPGFWIKKFYHPRHT